MIQVKGFETLKVYFSSENYAECRRWITEQYNSYDYSKNKEKYSAHVAPEPLVLFDDQKEYEQPKDYAKLYAESRESDVWKKEYDDYIKNHSDQSCYEISDALNCSQEAVRTSAKRIGVKLSKRSRWSYTDDDDQFMIDHLGEMTQGLAKDNRKQVLDSIGDAVVVLTILSQQLNTNITDCTELAYNEIANRKGKTIDGIFVKEADLKDGE